MAKLNRKNIWAEYRFLFLLIVLVFLVSCIGWILEKPSFVLRGIIIKPRSFSEMTLLLRLEAKNPNHFDLTLRSFEYTVDLAEEEVAKGRLENPFLLSSSSTTEIEVPVAVRFKDLGASLKAVLTGGELPYKIKGKAEVRAFFTNVHFPFSKEGRIDLKN